eukprot:gene8396-8580_t
MQQSDSTKLSRILRTSGWQVRKSIDEVGRLLDQDRDLGIDVVNDALIYVCSGIQTTVSPAISAKGAIPHSLTATAAGTVKSAAPPGEFLNGTAGPADPDPAVASVWSLSSRPTATKKIWLDFRGGWVFGSAWSTGNVSWPAYDSDGNPNTFTNTELGQIVAIWRAVAEDFAPFNVDVTTINQITVANTANSNYMRVAIGGSSEQVLNDSAGGIAYVGVFGRTDLKYQPAFVFPYSLCVTCQGNAGVKNVWEATSHEYDQGLTQWSKGEYVNANNKEDDLSIIAGKLGVTASVSVTGIVSQTAAFDFFKFQANGGVLSASAVPVNAYGSFSRSNLDLLVNVYNSAGNIIGTINSPGLAASGSVQLPVAGTYYLGVTGTGNGSLSTGYSAYGSLGQYLLSGTFPAPTNGQASPPP